MTNALILFVFIPPESPAKNKLMPHLCYEETAALHGCFAKDIYEKARQTDADVYVFFTPREKKSRIPEAAG